MSVRALFRHLYAVDIHGCQQEQIGDIAFACCSNLRLRSTWTGPTWCQTSSRRFFGLDPRRSCLLPHHQVYTVTSCNLYLQYVRKCRNTENVVISYSSFIYIASLQTDRLFAPFFRLNTFGVRNSGTSSTPPVPSGFWWGPFWWGEHRAAMLAVSLIQGHPCGTTHGVWSLDKR